MAKFCRTIPQREVVVCQSTVGCSLCLQKTSHFCFPPLILCSCRISYFPIKTDFAASVLHQPTFKKSQICTALCYSHKTYTKQGKSIRKSNTYFYIVPAIYRRQNLTTFPIHLHFVSPSIKSRSGLHQRLETTRRLASPKCNR